MTFTIHTGYVSATVASRLTLEDMRSIGDHVGLRLPGGWSVSPLTGASQSPWISLSFDASSPSIDLESQSSSNYKISLNSSIPIQRVGYIIYTALERDRQLQGMVTVHASAAVLPNGEAILLLGDKGSGKTSTLSMLIERGARPLGDDILVLQVRGPSVDVYPGKRLAAVRPAHATGENVLAYEDKCDVDLGAFSFWETSATVSKAVRLSVHPSVSENRMARIAEAPLAECLRLHENFARYITGAATPLDLSHESAFGITYATDCFRCSVTRRDLMATLLSGPFYYLQARDANAAADMVLCA